MATTLSSGFTIYNEWVQLGFLERIAQNINGFNANSNNAINLTTQDLVGDFSEEAFFAEIATAKMIFDRDKNGIGAVTPEALGDIETVIPQLPTRFGPFQSTRQAFLDKGKSPEEFSRLLGVALADNQMADMLNTGIAAFVAAVQHGGKMVVGGGSAGAASLSYTSLIDGMALYGDRIDEIACFVMRGKDYFGLMAGNVTAATIDSVAGATLNAGGVATFGKPVLVTDSPALLATGAAAKDSGAVLALTKNAITVAAGNDLYVESQTELLKENILINWQGEGNYTLRLKGYSFDKALAAGGITRDNAADGTKWTQNVTSEKNSGGGVIITKL